MSATVPIRDIQRGTRHRKEMGDVAALAESIGRVGLLHPVVVTSGNVLIAGERRLEACKRLGWNRVPVTVAEHIADARALLEAERDENTCREEMKPSEKVALGLALEELERPNAAARQREGGRIGGKGGKEGSVNFSEASAPLGNTVDIVGAAVGMSRPTYERARTVVNATTDESLPEATREVARGALAQMDATGKVTPAYDAVAPLLGMTPVSESRRRTRPPASAPAAPVVLDTDHRRTRAEAQKRKVVEVLAVISGAARGLRTEIDINRAVAAATAEEVAAWEATAGETVRTIKSFLSNLKRINA